MGGPPWGYPRRTSLLLPLSSGKHRLPAQTVPSIRSGYGNLYRGYRSEWLPDKNIQGTLPAARKGLKKDRLLDFILLQPIADLFMFGLVFGIHVSDDFFEFGFILDAIEEWVMFDIPNHPGVDDVPLITYPQII
jgi:hypothetical protein